MASRRSYPAADHRFSDFPLIDWDGHTLPFDKGTIMTTKSILIPAAIALVLTAATASAPAQAEGCLKGAAIGGFAGHMAGHGWLGAGAGCVIGRHEANRREREEMRRNAMEDARQEREFGGGGRW
jgi:hypothetical protein